MTGWMLAVLLTLCPGPDCDLVQSYQDTVEFGEYAATWAAYADWPPERIRVNTPHFWTIETGPGDDLNKWVACILVHEALHLYHRQGNSLHPYIYQRHLACLERLDAPRHQQDIIRSWSTG